MDGHVASQHQRSRKSEVPNLSLYAMWTRHPDTRCIGRIWQLQIVSREYLQSCLVNLQQKQKRRWLGHEMYPRDVPLYVDRDMCLAVLTFIWMTGFLMLKVGAKVQTHIPIAANCWYLLHTTLTLPLTDFDSRLLGNKGKVPTSPIYQTRCLRFETSSLVLPLTFSPVPLTTIIAQWVSSPCSIIYTDLPSAPQHSSSHLFNSSNLDTRC